MKGLTFYILSLFLFSSQAYLSILYLKPRTQIILRGKKNVAKLMTMRLKHIEHDVYKPQFSVSLLYLYVCLYVDGGIKPSHCLYLCLCLY